jgi:two-component system, chemotaxis family, sensor kinase CheA
MNERDEAFLKRLRETFRVEAAEHLQHISDGLLELEKGGEAAAQAQTVETVLREAHSLKGAARAVSFAEIEAVCQSLESVFASLKRQAVGPAGPLLDTLYDAVDVLGELLAAGDAAPHVGLKNKSAAVIRALEAAARGASTLNQAAPSQAKHNRAAPDPAAPAAPRSAPPLEVSREIESPAASPAPPDASAERAARAETVRVAAAKLDALLLRAEETLAAKLAGARLAADLRALGEARSEWERQWAKVLPEVNRLRSSPPRAASNRRAVTADSRAEPDRLTEFLEWNQGFVRALESRLAALAVAAEQDARATAAMVDSLLADAKSAVMLPFGTALEGFPKLVRDLALARGKEVELVVEGGEIEIDRRVLEEMKDPLLHLVRNAVDHGLETPAERGRAGKGARGTLTVSATQRGGSRIEIAVADDGAGVDVSAVRAKAVTSGLVSDKAAARLGDREVLSFIFHSGFSTSPIITDISGRGLGLAILREKAERLGGSISVESPPGQGTTFRVLLPLTLATFRGVLVECGGRLFVLPTAAVERVLRVRRSEVETVRGRETVVINARAVALVRLDRVLEIAGREAGEKDFKPAVVLSVAGQRAAFAVDAVLNEQEVIVKSLGTQLARVRNVAGATVLTTQDGAGQIVPVLNAFDLMKSATRLAGGAAGEMAVGASAAQGRAVLVADDSITSRTLLKNVLEGAGYAVRTAVDGLDAWATLKTEDFDLLVTDAEMPRLDGFELTARVRADERLKDLPVVLVTALASAEDRARGVDAGANAYIVKSSFDQGNLLEVVRRMI